MQRDAVHTFSLAVAVDVTARESDASAHPQGIDTEVHLHTALQELLC